MTRMDPVARQARVIEKLRESGHRLTPQRVAVLDVLLYTQEHLTAEQIHARVKADFPMTSLATIYKTVAVLAEMGEVLELGSSGDSNRYDGNPHPHPHLMCVQCRSIVDVEMSPLEDLPQEVAERTGYQIVGHQFDFFGICPACQDTCEDSPM